MITVNPPPMVKMPRKIAEDRELEPYFRHLERFWLQLWARTGGSDDLISETVDDASDGLTISSLSRLTDLEKRLNEMHDTNQEMTPLDLINKRITDLEAQL